MLIAFTSVKMDLLTSGDQEVDLPTKHVTSYRRNKRTWICEVIVHPRPVQRFRPVKTVIRDLMHDVFLDF